MELNSLHFFFILKKKIPNLLFTSYICYYNYFYLPSHPKKIKSKPLKSFIYKTTLFIDLSLYIFSTFDKHQFSHRNQHHQKHSNSKPDKSNNQQPRSERDHQYTPFINQPSHILQESMQKQQVAILEVNLAQTRSFPHLDTPTCERTFHIISFISCYTNVHI